MNLPKQKFRELTFQCLFSRQFTAGEESGGLSFYMKAFKTTKNNVSQAFELVEKIVEKQNEIDELIKATSLGFELNRIQSVELNILRLCIYELFYDSDVPGKVTISEGIRLAKKFSTKESVAFVNAIIDHIYKQKSPDMYDVVS